MERTGFYLEVDHLIARRLIAAEEILAARENSQKLIVK